MHFESGSWIFFGGITVVNISGTELKNAAIEFFGFLRGWHRWCQADGQGILFVNMVYMQTGSFVIWYIRCSYEINEYALAIQLYIFICFIIYIFYSLCKLYITLLIIITDSENITIILELPFQFQRLTFHNIATKYHLSKITSIY